MELNNTVRNRRVGFLGVAVATLLTPAGKLISSAVAAGVTMALVTTTMSDGTTAIDMENTPVPHLATSSAPIPEYFEVAMSELTISEPAAELLATGENSPGMMLASMPSAVVLTSNTDNGPSGGNLIEMPAMGSAFAPPPLVLRAPQVDCAQVLNKDASERTEQEKALCEAQITQTTEIKGEIIALYTEVTPTTGEGSNQPTLVVSNTPEEVVKTTGDGTNPPTDPNTPPKGLPSEPVSPTTGNALVTIAAIPEPSTIGLLLLGLFGLGWTARRNTGV